MGSSVDRNAFDNMNYATADKTAVNLTGDKAKVTSEDVHNMLMAAGFTPALGNIADLADAILYAAEGQFGAAGLSMAAVIPFIGQAVSAKRALKIAKESGEEMVTMWRGVDKWHQGTMTKNKKYIGGGKHTKFSKENMLWREGDDALWVTQHKSYAADIASTEKGVLLKFEVPRSYVDKHFTSVSRVVEHTSEGKKIGKETGLFMEGLPTAFITKVDKPPLGY